MSESQEPAPAGTPTGTPRYPRSSGGLVGAMIVTVLAVLAFVAFRAITRDNEPTPVRSVDYPAVVKAARGEKSLLVFAPDRLPLGWRATSATYTKGVSPTWHLGTLTEKRRYVGVEEARSSIENLAKEHVDPAAQRGQDVTIAGRTWQSWTDSGGDYAVARSLTAGELKAGGGVAESLLVVGTAPEAQIRAFAGSLKSASGSPGL